MSFPRLACFIVGAGTLAACQSATEPELDLVTARALWAAEGSSAYSMEIYRSCECIEQMTGPVTISVRRDEIESLSYVRTGEPVPSSHADLFPAVEDLFRLIEDARGDAVVIDVAHDPRYGYPTEVVISHGRPDAHVAYSVTNVRAH